MPETDLYREFEHYGLDTKSSAILRKPGFFEACNNIMPTLSGSLRKRPGYKGVGSSIGGGGLFSYIRQDDNTNEILTIGMGRLYRLVPSTITITYTGSGDATASFYYDDDQAQYVMVFEVDGDEVANIDLGLGLDNEFSTTLDDLNDDIDALTDFEASVSGDDTLPAALLFPLQNATDLDEPLILTTYDWEAVNAPLTAPLADFWAARNDDNFERASAVDIAGNKYIAALESVLMKYDGQNFYRAGMPQPVAPILDNTSATGAAEVTVITCVADNAAAEVTQVVFDTNDDSWSAGENNVSFIIYDNNNASVEVAFQKDGTASGSGLYDRVLSVSFTSNDTDSIVANKAKLIIDADSHFICTVLGDTITITNSSNGNRTDAFLGPDRDSEDTFTITTLTSGTSGLDGAYFTLGGPNETIAFWYDVDNDGTTEPAHGATRSVEITTVTTGMTAAQVATATEVFIEADAFNSTVSGAAITVTSSTNGARTDANSGTSGFGMSITTQGTNGGLGAGQYIYHTTYEQIDANEVVTEGMPSDDTTITISSSEDITVVIEQIQPDSGFNTGCAIVNGAQSNKNAITVDSGHTLNVGDWAFLKGQNQNAVKEVTTITTVADIASSLDGTWFYLYGTNGTSVQATAFWIDVDNNGTVEPAHGATHSVEITGITAGMSANDVASQINTTINGTTRWTSTVSTNVVTVTDVAFGPRTDAYDGASGTGFSFAVTTQGGNFRTGENILREITATAATSITIDGDPVTVVDNQPISNGLKINIWRTEVGGVVISKFLVDSIANNSFAATATYTDSIADEELGRPWEEPKLDHGLPPSGKYVSAWNNVMVIGGVVGSESTAYYGIAGETSPEYFPPESNQLLLNSIYSDAIRGLYPLSEVFDVFKDQSYFSFSGDIYQDNVRVDQMMKTDMQFMSHHSIIDLKEQITFLDRVGVFSLSPGAYPIEMSEFIRPSFIAAPTSSSFLRSLAAIRRDLAQLHYFIPREATTDGGDRYTLPTSQIFVFYRPTQQWYVWDAVNMAGGFIKYGNEYLFQEERWDEVTASMRYHLYRFHNEGLKYDYADGNEPIAASLRTARYGADTPEVYKKFTKVRAQQDPSLVAEGETLSVSSHRGILSTTAHSSFTLHPTEAGLMRQRLLPTKATALSLTLSNDNLHESMGLVGWAIEGAELESAHMQE